MAIANSDGSIILSTKVDTSGINKGMSQMQGKATSLTKTFSKLGAAIASAFAIQKIIQFSNEAGQLATQTEASVQRLVDIYGSASDAVGNFIDANARALGMSKAAAASFSSVYGNLFSVWADQTTNAELTNRYLNMTAVVASKTGRTVEDVQERVRSGLLGNTEAIEDLGIFVNVKTIEMTDAFQRMANGKSWEQLDAYTQQQIRSMAILEQATAKYGDEVAETSATTRNRYKAAYEDFQNSWGIIVNQVLLPVLQTLTKIFDIATAGFNALSGRSGQILENVELQEENTDKTAENIEEQTKNQKDLNKELKKSLAGFDDIQILSSKTADNTSGGLDSGLQGIGGDLGGTAPDGSAYVNEANDMLTAIMGFVSIAMVAIGVILLLTGHIGWGLGFIIAGAGLLTVTQASVSQEGVGIDVQNALTTALLIAGVAAIVIGIILCMCQQYVKGIALIALGAATVVADIAINWDSIKDMLSNEKVATWVAIGGILAVVLGILLCFAQQWWAGIGLIALGATALGVDVAVNWDSIKAILTAEKFAGWIAVAGLVAVVLGILLCFANLPLGIGLIALGATALVTVTALNWDAIKNAIQDNSDKIVIAGVLLVAIGILLCVAQSWAFGIGAIVAGAASIATAVSLDWNAIGGKIRQMFKDFAGVIAAIGVGMVVIGLLLCVAQAWALGIGAIVMGAGLLVATVALNWNAIVDNIKKFVFKNSTLISLISGGLLILGILICFINLPLGIALIAAGAVGLVTVTALNWNDIVGWVANAWNAIKNYWNNNIAPVFTLTWWKNLAIKCGNGLIAGFEGAINGIIKAFESMINWIVDGLNKISFDLPDWLGGGHFGMNIPRATLGRVSIPRLAQGAVIPPNREFLAVLGDQKQGTNIEAPLQTIVDAFNIALSQNSEYGIGNTEVILEIDGREFGRAVVEQGNRENRRIGTRLVIV